MITEIKKWSILTKKEFKELDITLKKEYIKRYGKKFYKKQAETDIHNQHRDDLDWGNTYVETSKAKEEV